MGPNHPPVRYIVVNTQVRQVIILSGRDIMDLGCFLDFRSLMVVFWVKWKPPSLSKMCNSLWGTIGNLEERYRGTLKSHIMVFWYLLISIEPCLERHITWARKLIYHRQGLYCIGQRRINSWGYSLVITCHLHWVAGCPGRVMKTQDSRLRWTWNQRNPSNPYLEIKTWIQIGTVRNVSPSALTLHCPCCRLRRSVASNLTHPVE